MASIGASGRHIASSFERNEPKPRQRLLSVLEGKSKRIAGRSDWTAIFKNVCGKERAGQFHLATIIGAALSKQSGYRARHKRSESTCLFVFTESRNQGCEAGNKG